MNTLERVVLGLPPSVLRKTPYTWFGVVVFYNISSLVSGVIAALLRSPAAQSPGAVDAAEGCGQVQL